MCGVKGKNCSGGRRCSSICNGGRNGNYTTNKPTTAKPTSLSKDSVINLDHGDPKLFRPLWETRAEECSITISGSDLVSYFSVDPATNVCWFLQPELGDAIRRLHRVAGNAVVDDDDESSSKFIVVGTGSSQLYQAALFALSTTATANDDDDDDDDYCQPLSVVSSAPYYSSYPDLTSYLKSGLYKWAGDANTFTPKEDHPYIEVVCYPNNPDGEIRGPVVIPSTTTGRRSEPRLIHDLAYYWPQYTPITTAADHDLMLFTFSKCTGHAGSRIGWAIVKDEEVARRMTKFIELNTIGTSKEAQLRAAKIMNVICDEYLDEQGRQEDQSQYQNQYFFEQAESVLVSRWERLRQALEKKKQKNKNKNGGSVLLPSLSVPDYPKRYCRFMGKFRRTYPAFAWVECEQEGVDAAAVMRENKILVRTGTRFGAHPSFVRISMLDSEESFSLFLERLAAI